MRKWTDEQRQAIDRDGNLLVSAAAGSGKTAVLTERFVRLIMEGTSIRQFLCVTFTKAAAAEMKKRVERRLAEAALSAADDETRARLHAAAGEVSRANISTFDSFCSEVLRRHFHAAGLDPAFRVLDDAEMNVMKQEAWDQVAEERCGNEDGRFADLVEALGDREEKAMELILGVYEYALSQPDPLGWLENAVEGYRLTGSELAASPAMGEYMRQCRGRLAAAAERLQGVRDTVAPEYPAIAAQLDEDLMAVRGVLLNETYAAYGAALGGFTKFGAIGWKKAGISEEERKTVEKARDDLKKTLKEQKSTFAAPVEQLAEQLGNQYPLMRELYETVAALHACYGAAKDARSLIDYSDMEHKVLALFKNEAIAGEYRSRFRYVFMDEYQDANPIQEAILSTILREDGLFLVGDVKQSIYRFRMAEPRLFMERYARYKAGQGGMRIDLNANFRSARGVVDAVNGVFSRIMKAEAAEIEYDDAAALVHGRADDAPGGAELCIADMAGAPALGDEEAAQEDEGEELDVAELEAAMAAKRIHEMMETEQVRDGDTGEMRPLRYSDFAVLLRSHKTVAEVWTGVLSRAGIPAYAELTGGFFDALEVRLFMELLRAIDNRRRDISMAAVMRSPIGGFTVTEMAALRTEYGYDEAGKTLACVDSLTLAAQAETPLGVKAKRLLANMERWQALSRLLSVEELCGLLLDETGYAAFCRALPEGKQRLANLNAFTERARMYERSGVRGLSSFLSFMEKVSGTNRLGAAQTAGADVVRVMSIHKSKGLEFPVVIVAGLGKQFNLLDARAPIVMDGAFGIGAKLTRNGRRGETLFRQLIAGRIEEKNKAEEMRVLYVAMTRARERLILIAALKEAEKVIRNAAQPQSLAQIGDAKCFADWVLGAVLSTEDGDVLRKRYGLPWRKGAPGGWMQVRVMPTVGAKLAQGRMAEEEYRAFARAARTDAGGMEGLFSRTYAYEEATTLPSRVTVTGLAGHEITMTEAPGFAEKDARLTAADRGTATHALLRSIALKAHTAQTVGAELARLQGAGLLTGQEAAAIDPASIAAFFRSPLGQRLVAAGTVHRELEFNYRVSARRLLDANTDEPILLQGVIDCCFAEGDAWVLLDYKTDFVPRGTSPYEAAAKHMRQVSLYAEALAALTGRPVKEAYVCLLNIGENVRLI